MAITAAEIDEAIRNIKDNGQSVSIGDTTYTEANISALFTIQQDLEAREARQQGTRPLMRRVNTSGMGY